MIVDLRTLFAVLFTFTMTYAGLGRALPFDFASPLALVVSLSLFIGCLYGLRTLIRLPFALVITFRRARYARHHYGLNVRESLRDGFVRGFLDTRRWTTNPFALIDRLGVITITLLTTIPFLGTFLVTLMGMTGIALLLILYLVRGKFSFLVEDSLADPTITSAAAFPFLKTRD
jgi:hypothetical protein